MKKRSQVVTQHTMITCIFKSSDYILESTSLCFINYFDKNVFETSIRINLYIRNIRQLRRRSFRHVGRDDRSGSWRKPSFQVSPVNLVPRVSPERGWVRTFARTNFARFIFLPPRLFTPGALRNNKTKNSPYSPEAYIQS